jgi:hypothetical protein
VLQQLPIRPANQHGVKESNKGGGEMKLIIDQLNYLWITHVPRACGRLCERLIDSPISDRALYCFPGSPTHRMESEAIGKLDSPRAWAHSIAGEVSNPATTAHPPRALTREPSGGALSVRADLLKEM